MGLVPKHLRDRIGCPHRKIELVGAGKGGAEIAALIRDDQGMKLQIQAEGELELRRERMSTAVALAIGYKPEMEAPAILN